MQKRIIYIVNILIFLVCSSLIFSQESEEKREIRDKWFWGQRTYPNESNHIDAYANAIEQRDNLRSSQGYQLSSPNVWLSIGPTPYDQYFTGRVSAVKVDPENPNIAYLTGANGGVWKTTNLMDNYASVVWTPLTDDFPIMSSGALAIDPENSDVIYYGTGENTYFFVYSYPGLGIYKSVNGGATWITPQTNIPNRSKIFKIAVNPVDGNIVFAAASTGLYKSTDAGMNWNRVIPDPEVNYNRQCNDVVVSEDGETVWVCGPSPTWWIEEYYGVGYQKSTDGGTTFSTPLNPGFSPVGRTQIDVCKSNNNKVFAATVTTHPVWSQQYQQYVDVEVK